MKKLFSALFIGGYLLSSAPTVMASTPALPALTLSQKVKISSYVVLGEIEKIDVMQERSEPEHLFYKVPDDTPAGIKVITIRVLNVLKPNGMETFSRVRVIDKGWNGAYAPNTKLVFFLRKANFGKSDPAEIFEKYPVTTYPQHGDWARPEPSERGGDIEILIRALGNSGQ